MSLFFMNCENTVLSSVKHDLDPPLPPSTIRYNLHVVLLTTCMLLICIGKSGLTCYFFASLCTELSRQGPNEMCQKKNLFH